MRAYCAGDRLPRGAFSLHSRFGSAANFTGPGGLLTLAAPEVGAGPVNIVVSPEIIASAKTVSNRRGNIFIDSEPVSADGGYCSEFIPEHGAERHFRRNLPALKKLLSDCAPPESIARAAETRGKTASQKLFARRALSGMRALGRGDYRRGAGLLRGLGPGFTPSGDDFLAGFLWGLAVRGKLSGRRCGAARRALLNAAKGKNPVSNAFLECAAEGRFFEKLKNLAQALGSDTGFDGEFYAVLNCGATSGADTMSGFCLALDSRPDKAAGLSRGAGALRATG